MGSEELAVFVCGGCVVALVLERDGGADRGRDRVARMDQDRGVTAAGPGVFEPREGRPARSGVAELRPDQAAVGIDAVDDDVMEEVERAAERVDHLQHQDGGMAVTQLVLDRGAVAGDEACVEAFAARGDEHVDGEHAAAHLRQRRVPRLHRRRIAVVLKDGGERTGAARFDAPFLHRHVGDDRRGRAGVLRARRDGHAGGQQTADSGQQEGGNESGEHVARPIRIPRLVHDSAMTRISAARAPMPTQIHSCLVRPAVCSWSRFWASW